MEQIRAKKSLQGCCCLYNIQLKLNAKNTGRLKKYRLPGLFISNSGVILLFRFFIYSLFVFISFHKSILSSEKALQKEAATTASFKGQEPKNSFNSKLSTSV